MSSQGEDDPLAPLTRFVMRGHEWIVVRRQYDDQTKALTITLRTTEDFIAEDFRRRLEEADVGDGLRDELEGGQ